MNLKHTFLIGCGAQARYALATFGKTGVKVSGIFDPVGGRIGTMLDRFKIRPFSEFDHMLNSGEAVHAPALICMSDNRMKQDLFNRLKKRVEFISAIHPGSHVAGRSTLGKGVIINACAVIQPDAVIGDGCMLHAGVIVEHDNIIGNFANLAPGVTLAGGAAVGERTTIYTGAIIAPNINIGKDSIIGAGSVVLSDIPDRAFACGSPAKIIRKNP